MEIRSVKLVGLRSISPLRGGPKMGPLRGETPSQRLQGLSLLGREGLEFRRFRKTREPA